MRSIFLVTPCLLIAITAGLLTADNNYFKSFNSAYDSSGNTYYVFVIDIHLREKKDDVENSANWRYLGNIADNIPTCAPGVLQACQLIVDERDTEISKDGVRVLKSDVSISARLNKKVNIWYVKWYISGGAYYYKILNEEED